MGLCSLSPERHDDDQGDDGSLQEALADAGLFRDNRRGLQEKCRGINCPPSAGLTAFLFHSALGPLPLAPAFPGMGGLQCGRPFLLHHTMPFGGH